MSDPFPKWASSEISADLHIVRQTGENAAVDFKEAFPEQAHRLGKEIAAMASSGGGRIYIGINDNGELCGITAANGDERDDIAERAHSIARAVKPIPKVNFLFAVESTSTILVIDIPKQDYPVFYYDHRPYIRDDRRARPAEPEEVVQLVWAHPSSEHKREMERIQQQQARYFIDGNRQS
jgi:ATP-dependent DNA helicase RecG